MLLHNSSSKPERWHTTSALERGWMEPSSPLLSSSKRRLPRKGQKGSKESSRPAVTMTLELFSWVECLLSNVWRGLLATLQLSGPVRDTPPYRAIPFRDSIEEGGIAPISLVFIGYRASIAEIPLLWGGIAPPLRMLSKGESLRKGGGGIAPNWPC